MMGISGGAGGLMFGFGERQGQGQNAGQGAATELRRHGLEFANHFGNIDARFGRSFGADFGRMGPIVGGLIGL